MDIPDLSQEYRLLLQSASNWLQRDVQLLAPAFDAETLDWDLLLRLAAWHQLDGLLSSQLQTPNPGVPSTVARRLAQRAAENRIRFSGFVEPALGLALTTLNRLDIPVIVLKGAALIRRAIDDPRLRPIGDLDLLLREGDLPQARRALLDLGYRQQPAVPGTIPSPLDYHYCPRMLSPDGSVEIELHRHLVRGDSPTYFEIEGMWQRARPGTFAGVPALTLAPADLVSHLCLAFFSDRRRRDKSFAAIRQLVDIAAAVRYHTDELEKSRPLVSWQASPSRGPIFCALWTARQLVDCAVPDDDLEVLRPPDCQERDLRLFMLTKVLDTEPWNLNGLVDPAESTPWNVTKALLHRFAPPETLLRREYSDSRSQGRLDLYRAYYSELARTALGLLRNPGSFSDDLRTDLWMNRLELARD